MKKIVRLIIIIGIILLFCLSLFIYYLSKRPATPLDYQKKVQTKEAIENKYMENGNYEVSYYQETVLQGFKKYILYYPTQLEESNTAFPVIVLCNGSGTPCLNIQRLPSI